jgi:hypothetical protein
MRRSLFFTGVAAGYVLGARAGRSHFEALTRAVRGLLDRPEVQSTAGILSAQASVLARSALGKDRVDATAHVSPN